MVAQNQRLLQLASEREAYNMKVCAQLPPLAEFYYMSLEANAGSL